MFEKACLDTLGTLKSPWALTFSTVGQALAVTAGILVSLIRTDSLPRSPFSTTIVTPGASPAKPAQSNPPLTTRPAKPSPHVFTAPAIVPARKSLAPELGLVPAPPGVSNEFPVIGGIGDGSGLSSVLIDAIARPLPPRLDPPAQRRPAVSAPAKPIPVSTGVQAAKLIRQVAPVYPPLARQARISGLVRLVAIIGRDGSIQNLQVTSGHPLLAPAAVEAVKQWRYHPTLLNDEPVEVITQIDVNFTLTR